MLQLDRLDKRILSELDRNSRLPVSELARKLKQGRDRVEYRIERLFEQKILKKCTTSVNLARLGLTIYKLYFRLENNREQVAAFVSFLRAHPRVYWIALSDGSWDLMIAVFARSSVDYYETQREILSEFNSIILNFGMYQLVELEVFHKEYFAGKGTQSVIVGGFTSSESVDDLDYDILKSLSQNSRRSVTDIAEMVGSTAAVVKYRIDRMEEKRIITGYRIEVDLARLGMQFFKSQLFLRSYEMRLQRQLRQYCAENPHITYFIQQLGDCTIELEMEVEDYRHYSSIIDEIRSSFSGLVRNFQTVMIRKTYFNWVPRDLQL
jgi:Lrp/AsnC family leucine-responsive transcriptional regulator